MWFLPRVLKSCWRSSSRPDTRWCSPQRAWSGPTDTWRTNTPMSGRATGSWAQGVCTPVLSVTQLWQATQNIGAKCQLSPELVLSGSAHSQSVQNSKNLYKWTTNALWSDAITVNGYTLYWSTVSRNVQEIQQCTNQNVDINNTWFTCIYSTQ